MGFFDSSIFDIFKKKKKLSGPWEKYYTEEEKNIEIPDISVYDMVVLSEHKYSKLKAIEYLGRKITYKKLLKEVNKTAKAFKQIGVQKGDIVTICLPNFPEGLYCFYALNKLGAVANMTHPLSSEGEYKEACTSTKSTVLVMCDQFYNKIENIVNETDLKNIVFVSAAESMNPFMGLAYRLSNIKKFKKYPKKGTYMMSWNKFRALGRKQPDMKYVKMGKNQPAVIIHSGGTSGTPKNVVLQNRAFYLQSKQDEIRLKLRVGDSCLAILPNFHGFGLSVSMHTAISCGCYTTLVPQFNAKKFDILFNKTKPTVVVGVPTLFEALITCNNVKNLDLSCIRYLISGGDYLPKSLEDRVDAWLKEHNSSAKITQGYGLSEALAAVSLCLGDINKSGSIGIPMPGNYIKIINPGTRKEVPYGTEGEICVHTKSLMLGYLNNESETNDALQMHDDGHVWLHTGDLGYMDEDGFIFYKGRIKRMIITSGYNVYPSHIEDVIESHPDVLQCTVVGVPHPYKQEVAKAFIVLKDGKHTLFVKNSIKELCKKNLAKYMVPAEFVFRKQLPKTKLGKVDFQSLKNDTGADDDDE